MQKIRRRSFTQGRLSFDRIKSLEDLGFKWDLQKKYLQGVLMKHWNTKISLVIPMLLLNIKLPQASDLDNGKQFKDNYIEKVKLVPDRIKRFEDIGFKWKLKKE